MNSSSFSCSGCIASVALLKAAFPSSYGPSVIHTYIHKVRKRIHVCTHTHVLGDLSHHLSCDTLLYVYSLSFDRVTLNLVSPVPPSESTLDARRPGKTFHR